MAEKVQKTKARKVAAAAMRDVYMDVLSPDWAAEQMCYRLDFGLERTDVPMDDPINNPFKF